MHKRRLLIAMASLFLLAGLARSQVPFGYNAGAETAFAEALRSFTAGNYADAYAVFDSLARLQPVHQRTTASCLMASNALYRLQRYRESILLLLDLLKRYPLSTYAGDAHYLLATDYLMLHWYEESAVQCIRSIDTARVPAMAAEARQLFEDVSDAHLDWEALDRLRAKTRNPFTLDLIEMNLAQKYVEAGMIPEANGTIASLLERGAIPGDDPRIRRLKARIAGYNPLKIGMVLPLMGSAPDGPLKSLAEDLLAGSTLALDRFKRESFSAWTVSLEVKDVGRDSAAALDAVRALGASRDVLAVIGPLFSDAAAACAPIANRAGLPLISPTASGDSIASIWPGVFQLSPDYAMRGAAMARYAVQQLGMKTLAILSSAEPMGKAMAESFAREATRLGATIIAAQSYAKGSGDLHAQFLEIRRAGLALQAMQDSAENTDVAVNTIEGIYLPISDPEEIGILSSQLAYFNLRTQMLGSAEWNNPDQLDANRRYVNGLLFASDVYLDHDDSTTARFEKEYLDAARRDATRYAVIGYDTMKLILDRIRGGAVTRDGLERALERLKDYQTLHSRITLTHGRVNSELHILKYLKGEITRVADVSVE